MIHKRENLHSKSGIYKSFKGMHPDTRMSADAQSFLLKLSHQYPLETVMTHQFEVKFRVILDRAGNYAIRDGRKTVSLEDVKNAVVNHPLVSKSPKKAKSPKRKSVSNKAKSVSKKAKSPKRKSVSNKAKSVSRKAKSPKRKSVSRRVGAKTHKKV